MSKLKSKFFKKNIRLKLRKICIKNRTSSRDSILELGVQDSIGLATYIYVNQNPPNAEYPFYKYCEIMDSQDFMGEKVYEEWNTFRGLLIKWFCRRKTIIVKT